MGERVAVTGAGGIAAVAPAPVPARLLSRGQSVIGGGRPILASDRPVMMMMIVMSPREK